MIFTPAIINHTLPQVSVTANDAGVPAVTYNQIKQSLGNHVYNIEKIYLQANILNQLTGVVQYNRYEATGNQQFKSITPTVDPYQRAKSLYIELEGLDTYFILNGNSNLSTTILPLAMLDVTFYCKRVTNSFGTNLNSFKVFEQIFKKPDFFQSYGDIDKIQETNQKIAKTASFSG